jgi:putative FmdB family regulatory protein
MPTYEYRCRDCGQHLEVVQSFTDDPLTVCPSCEGNLKKVFNSVGISFKGSGFYKNDSRSTAGKGSGRSASSDGESSSSSGAGEKSSSASSSSTPSSESGSGSAGSTAAAAAG